MKQRIAQLAGSALIGSLLLAGASSAFAQTYGSSGTTGTGSTVTPAANTTGSNGTNGTGTTGTMSSSSTTGTNGSTTPGIPNTGAGGDTAANIALLTTSGIVVLGGAAYLLRRKNAFE